MNSISTKTSAATQPSVYVVAIFFISLIVLAVLPRVSELHGYFHFVDTRQFFGIENTLDTLSNLPFAIFGVWGLWRVAHSEQHVPLQSFANLFFAGLILTSLCSAWFHLSPLQAGRVEIDRFGMLFAFAGLLGLLAAHFKSPQWGLPVVFLTLAIGLIGLVSTLAWGNVLPWAVLQLTGALAVAYCAMTQAITQAAPGQSRSKLTGLAIIAVAYLLAKAAEMNDGVIFEFTQHTLSGHTLKHLLASLAALPVLFWFGSRKFLP